MSRLNAVCFLFLTGLACPVAAQTLLLVPDSTNDRVSAFSPVDGSLVNLTLIPNHGGMSTPINAIESGRGTIFLSDQIADSVFEYTYTGTFVGVVMSPVINGLDNIRGIAVYQGGLYVTVAGGTFANTIQRLDLTTNVQSTWATGVDPFDIHFRANDVLVADIGDDNIEAFNFLGAPLAPFHNSDGVSGVDFPEQIYATTSGDVLVAGFSPPDGVYRYSSTGTQLSVVASSTGPRGVYELQNGNIMYTNGSGVFVLDTATGGVQSVASGSYRFIDPVTVPEPSATLGWLAAMALITGKRWLR